MSQIKHIVSISGGKDSTALYLYALERGKPFHAVFADTGNEHELTYEYVERLADATGGPTIQWVKADFTDRFNTKRQTIREKWPVDGVPMDRVERALELFQPTGNPFLDLCMLKGRFPSSRVRFCTEELKVLPIDRQVYAPAWDEGKGVVSWQGVRADESLARSHLPMFQPMNARGWLWAFRPLLHWTRENVFSYHARHGLKPNPLYEMGMGRVGCMPCIMCRKDELRAISARFPDHIERISEWERLVSEVSKRGSSTFFAAADEDPGIPNEHVHYTTHGVHERVKWSRTSHGGKQFNMLLDPAIEFGTACNQWGLCEAGEAA